MRIFTNTIKVILITCFTITVVFCTAALTKYIGTYLS